MVTNCIAIWCTAGLSFKEQIPDKFGKLIFFLSGIIFMVWYNVPSTVQVNLQYRTFHNNQKIYYLNVICHKVNTSSHLPMVYRILMWKKSSFAGDKNNVLYTKLNQIYLYQQLSSWDKTFFVVLASKACTLMRTSMLCSVFEETICNAHKRFSTFTCVRLFSAKLHLARESRLNERHHQPQVQWL